MTKQIPSTKVQILKKRLVRVLVTALFLVSFNGVLWGKGRVEKVLDCAGLSWREAVGLVQKARENSRQVQKDEYTFLVLGLDRRDDAFEHTLLTDTMLLASLNIAEAKLTLTSLPRDWWIPELQTKINALYFYAKAQSVTPDPLDWVGMQIEKLTGQAIDTVVVVDQGFLAEVVEVVGGVTVNLPEGFVDEEYPNSEYIQNPASGAGIYKTITFAKGENRLNGERVLEFVRSRKGEDVSASESGVGSTDLGRAKRQQMVIEALIGRLKDRDVLGDPCMVGNLIVLWNEQIESGWKIPDWGGLVFKLGGRLVHMQIAKKELPVDGDKAVLYHPQIGDFGGQWVWLSTSEEEVKDFFLTKTTK